MKDTQGNNKSISTAWVWASQRRGIFYSLGISCIYCSGGSHVMYHRVSKELSLSCFDKDIKWRYLRWGYTLIK